MEMHHESSNFLRRLRDGAHITIEELTEAFSRLVSKSKKIVQLVSCWHVDDTTGSSSALMAP